jgi:poly(A) polymerase
MREIWMMQPRFERRVGNAPFTLVEQPRFRAGFDFLRLRADAGEIDPTLAEWWEDFSLGDEEERRALMDMLRSKEGPRRVPASATGAGATGNAAATVTADSEPAKKRRRRRRKPAMGGGDERADERGAPAADLAKPTHGD